MKKFALALLALATALAITPSAMGDTIVALSSTPAVVNATSVTSPLGTLQATTSGTVSGSGTTWFTASYTEWVYSDPSNPLGAGDLAFVYSVKNTGADSIDTVSTTSFGNYSVSEGNIVGSGGSGIHALLGDDVLGVPTINFSGALLGGKTLDTYVLFTNSTAYTTGSIDFIDGSVATDSALVPATTTPEPSSLLLLGTGLLGLAFVAFRKAKPARPVMHLSL